MFFAHDLKINTKVPFEESYNFYTLDALTLRSTHLNLLFMYYFSIEKKNVFNQFPNIP